MLAVTCAPPRSSSSVSASPRRTLRRRESSGVASTSVICNLPVGFRPLFRSAYMGPLQHLGTNISGTFAVLTTSGDLSVTGAVAGDALLINELVALNVPA